MSEKQILTMLARMLDHWELFAQLPTEIRRQVIGNPKEMVPLICELLKERLQPPPPEPPLFDLVNRIIVTSHVPGCEVSKTTHLDGELFEWFTRASKNFTILCCYRLRQRAHDGEIIRKLGGPETIKTSPSQIGFLIERQKNGREGVLNTNGKANVFYVNNPDTDSLHVRIISRSDGIWRSIVVPIAWNDRVMHLGSHVEDHHVWGPGDQIIIPMGCWPCLQKHVAGKGVLPMPVPLNHES